MARRSELDICADILRVAEEGARKTHIVYGANLNFNIVKKYLSKLLSHDLIRLEGVSYTTTGKGYEFLMRYEGLVNGFG